MNCKLNSMTWSYEVWTAGSRVGILTREDAVNGHRCSASRCTVCVVAEFVVVPTSRTSRQPPNISRGADFDSSGELLTTDNRLHLPFRLLMSKALWYNLLGTFPD